MNSREILRLLLNKKIDGSSAENGGGARGNLNHKPTRLLIT